VSENSAECLFAYTLPEKCFQNAIWNEYTLSISPSRRIVDFLPQTAQSLLTGDHTLGAARLHYVSAWHSWSYHAGFWTRLMQLIAIKLARSERSKPLPNQKWLGQKARTPSYAQRPV